MELLCRVDQNNGKVLIYAPTLIGIIRVVNEDSIALSPCRNLRLFCTCSAELVLAILFAT